MNGSALADAAVAPFDTIAGIDTIDNGRAAEPPMVSRYSRAVPADADTGSRTGTAPARQAAGAIGDGTLYRGGAGMWSWVAHRITGLLTFFFLFLHVLDVALVRVSPDSYDRVMEMYKNPVAAVVEVALVGAVLYHVLNGLRVTAIDMWEDGPRHQRRMLWAVLAVWIVLMVPSGYFLLRSAFETWFGAK